MSESRFFPYFAQGVGEAVQCLQLFSHQRADNANISKLHPTKLRPPTKLSPPPAPFCHCPNLVSSTSRLIPQSLLGDCSDDTCSLVLIEITPTLAPDYLLRMKSEGLLVFSSFLS